MGLLEGLHAVKMIEVALDAALLKQICINYMFQWNDLKVMTCAQSALKVSLIALKLVFSPAGRRRQKHTKCRLHSPKLGMRALLAIQ